MEFKRNFFTVEQQEILRKNPFTLEVTERYIRFTVEFKKFLLEEREKNGTTYKNIFRKAGYDPEMLGHYRIIGISKKIQEEKKSPRGLHETAAKTHYTKENERVQTQKAIKQLQDEVLRLQQQIEFLKKTQVIKALDEMEN